MTYLNNFKNLSTILIIIYCFIDDFIKGIVNTIQYALKRPDQNSPPTKKHNLNLSELISMGIFRFFTGHKNWKDYYKFISNYHSNDFKDLPNYKNFLEAINKTSCFALIILTYLMKFFKSNTEISDLKLADSTKLKVCENKREFTHKVCKNIAGKGKGSMGWFYGFKLHVISNELMQILSLTISTGNTDDRKGLDKIWNDIFGMIIADAGYLGKNWIDKAQSLGKHLFTAVKANMKKLMTSAQHELLKIRQKVETVFSVLKLRMGIETTLPRSPLGYFSHYIWCLTAYQLDQYFRHIFTKKLDFNRFLA